MKLDLPTIAAIFISSGVALQGIDENNTGADDYAGTLLEYAGDSVNAVHNGEELSPLPDILQKGIQDKLGQKARVSLTVAISILPFLEASAGKKYAVALKYLRQTFQLLLAGKPVPPLKSADAAALGLPVKA